jgi:hypothetical protein
MVTTTITKMIEYSGESHGKRSFPRIKLMTHLQICLLFAVGKQQDPRQEEIARNEVLLMRREVLVALQAGWM